MMILFRSLVAAFVLSLGAGAFASYAMAEAEGPACAIRFQSSGFCSEIRWIVGPSTGKENSFLLQLTDLATGKPRELGDLNFKATLYMPSMGHGSSPTVLTRPLDESGNTIPGLYRVTSVHFMMKGDWQLILQIREAKKVLDQHILEFDL